MLQIQCKTIRQFLEERYSGVTFLKSVSFDNNNFSTLWEKDCQENEYSKIVVTFYNHSILIHELIGEKNVKEWKYSFEIGTLENYLQCQFLEENKNMVKIN